MLTLQPYPNPTDPNHADPNPKPEPNPHVQMCFKLNDRDACTRRVHMQSSSSGRLLVRPTNQPTNYS